MPPSPNPTRESRLLPQSQGLSNLPWWLIVAIAIGGIITLLIITDEQMNIIFRAIITGIGVTLSVTFMAYTLAITLGLIFGLGRVSHNKIIFNIASFYVEIVRGIPMLVLLMYIAFVGVPLVIQGINALGNLLLNIGLPFGAALAEVTSRNVDNMLRVVLGLGFAYGAFSAEIFRAGIEAVDKGQVEAAQALGMTYNQTMRFVVLPQAIRNVLPALGNDFVAMLKDSSLVSVLGVRDLTQITKLYAASTFLFFQAYSILAFIYLAMTILLTRLIRRLENHLAQSRRR
ncbi:MAG: amino acid ABC transporter permease [Anaerolineales bacterium]